MATLFSYVVDHDLGFAPNPSSGYRREYFRELMGKQSIPGLKFQWFVTHDETNKIIPALAEMKLLQVHFDEYGCLPKLNLCA